MYISNKLIHDIMCIYIVTVHLESWVRRCIQVFRDEADQEDLLVLGAECLGLSLEDQASKCLVEGFCAAFRHSLRL